MPSVMVLIAGARHLDWELACKLWPFWRVLFCRWALSGQPGQLDQPSSRQISFCRVTVERLDCFESPFQVGSATLQQPESCQVK